MINYYEKYVAYINNSGLSNKNGKYAKIKFFDEDFEPIGENIRNDMIKNGIAKNINIKGIDYILLI